MARRTLLRRRDPERPVGLGVDLATVRPAIARPGFTDWVLTEAPDLVTWQLSPPRLWWHASWLGELDVEHPVALAVPAWMGPGARRSLVRDVHDARQRPAPVEAPADGDVGRPAAEGSAGAVSRPDVRVVHATLAAVVGALAEGRLEGARHVLAIDGGVGMSASLVEIDDHTVTERAAWAWTPAQAARGIDADHLSLAAAEVLAARGARLDVVLAVVRGPGTRAGAGGSSSLAGLGRVRVERCGAATVAVGAARSCRNERTVVGCTVRALAGAPGDQGGLAWQTCWAIAPHTALPANGRLVFDLGDDDGQELVVELFDGGTAAGDGSASEHDEPEALVRFVGRRGYDPICELFVELDADGVLHVRPTALWELLEERSRESASSHRWTSTAADTSVASVTADDPISRRRS